MKKYSLGLDFGTLSVRSLFLDIETGEEAASAVFEYPHGVMTSALPDGTALPEDFALEHPQDFIDGMKYVIRQGMREKNILPEEVVGIGVDVTTATVLPADETGRPLSEYPGFSSRPQAWMKLWKHHGAEKIAERMLAVARERKEPWLEFCGDCLSCELFMPKAVELAIKDPEVFDNTYTIIEAADWIVWQLTGCLTRSRALAGCNSLYLRDAGYPSKDYFKAVYPGAENVPDKLVGPVIPLGERAGCLTENMAAELGLKAGTPVGVAMLDSHAAVIGCGASRVGDMVSVIGTTTCNMLNAADCHGIPGIYSAAPDANVPGLCGYEGGQNCVGDSLAWFMDNCLPEKYMAEARREGVNIHTYLQNKAEKLRPGESGLLALDWLNGVRSPLIDFTLRSCIVGLSIRTKPEEIYRALIEGTVFGNKRIIDTYEKGGSPVKRIIAAGGIPMKNSMMMQILADVCNRDIYLCGTSQASARGSAILGAIAAGSEVHGCTDSHELIEKLGKLSNVVYHPIVENVAVYEKLYALYLRLSDEMARENSVGRELQKLRNI